MAENLIEDLELIGHPSLVIISLSREPAVPDFLANGKLAFL